MNKNLIRISLDQDGSTVVLHAPDSFESATRFSDFVSGLDGVAFFDRETRRRTAPLGRLAALTTRLREKSFDVELTNEARSALQRFSAAQMFELQRVRERIAQVDVQIKLLQEKKGEKPVGLYSYQRFGSEWLTMTTGGLLADQMGTGKTLQTIAAIPLQTPVLVTCPASLKGNWVKEVALWRPHLTTFVLKGRTSFRWPKPGEILITNYDILPDVHDRNGIKGRVCDGFLPPDPCPGCFKEPGFKGGKIQPVKVKGQHLPECTGYLAPKRCPGCHPILDSAPEGMILIADEAQNLKNPKSARAQRYTAMAEAVLELKRGRSWAATGTPLENHPRDLWSLLVALGLAKRVFPNGFDEFARLFRAQPKYKGDRFVGWDWPELTAEDAEKIRPRLERVMLRRLRHEVLDLPDKIYQQDDVELDRKTFAACEAFVRANGGLDRLVEIIEKGKESAGIQGLSTLRQALAMAKIPHMLEIVQSYEDQDEPVCVFSVHRGPIEILKKRPGWGVVMGGEKNVTEVVEAFQAGKLKGLAYTISGGTGLTLTRAANLIRIDRDWRPTMDEQVEDRLMRIGQQRRVLIRDLVSNHPLEQRITELHRRKRGFIAHSVDAAAAKVKVDDAPQSKIDQEVQAIREEAFRGRAMRRIASGPEERDIIERLLRYVFEKRSDERLAGELAEQAQTIGLSEAQWRLAASIAERGREREATMRTELEDEIEAPV